MAHRPRSRDSLGVAALARRLSYRNGRSAWCGLGNTPDATPAISQFVDAADSRDPAPSIIQRTPFRPEDRAQDGISTAGHSLLSPDIRAGNRSAPSLGQSRTFRAASASHETHRGTAKLG